MERVDVTVVGGGAAGLAAAWAAAAGGVRVAVIDERELPRNAQLLYRLSARDLMDLNLDPAAADRTFDREATEGHPQVAIGGQLSAHAVRASALHHHLYTRARGSGAEIRDLARATSAELEPDGWVVRLEQGEPIRAPVLIIADGARSGALVGIGIARAQRCTETQAEVMSCLCVTWDLPPGHGADFEMPRVFEGAGPLGRWEVLPGSDRVTLAVGPIWQSVAGREPGWPNTDPQVLGAIERAGKAVGLVGAPRAVEVEEWRIDALPIPPVFDGGLVIGAAAGHRPHRALSAQAALVRGGRLAGRAAAQAVLSGDWGAASLSQHLGERYRLELSEIEAELTYAAHGLRHRRAFDDNFMLVAE